MNIRKRIGEYLIVICIGVMLGIFVSNFLVRSIEVQGVSMESTLVEGDKILIREVGRYSSGDIVVFFHGKDTLVKRIIAVGGDTIKVEDSKVYVNGSTLEEGYINEKEFTSGIAGTEITLGENEYFVMGDNRNHSKDSRVFGPINKDDVLGVKLY